MTTDQITALAKEIATKLDAECLYYSEDDTSKILAESIIVCVLGRLSASPPPAPQPAGFCNKCGHVGPVNADGSHDGCSYAAEVVQPAASEPQPSERPDSSGLWFRDEKIWTIALKCSGAWWWDADFEWWRGGTSLNNIPIGRWLKASPARVRELEGAELQVVERVESLIERDLKERLAHSKSELAAQGPKLIEWTAVKDQPPPRHRRSLVRRDGMLFTATPCYGMHEPWWVVLTMGAGPANEAEPVSMLDTDHWQNLPPAPRSVT